MTESNSFWIILVAVFSLYVFCRGWYVGVLSTGFSKLSNWIQLHQIAAIQDVTKEEIMEATGYDPFETVARVAKKAGIPVPDLLIFRDSEDTFFIGAMDCGDRTAIITQTLFVEQTPEPLFEGAVAHEIGHLLMLKRSLWRYAEYAAFGFINCSTELFRLGVVLAIGADFLYLISLPPPNAMIFGIGTVFAVAALARVLQWCCVPVHAALLRREEYAADKKALSLIRAPEALVFILFVISQINASEPPFAEGVLGSYQRLLWWIFRDHPPIQKRIQVLQKILKKDYGMDVRFTVENREPQ